VPPTDRELLIIAHEYSRAFEEQTMMAAIDVDARARLWSDTTFLLLRPFSPN
jgi:hypothetical protein